MDQTQVWSPRSSPYSLSSNEHTDGSSLIIQHLQFIQNDNQVIKQKLNKLDELVEHLESLNHAILGIGKRLYHLESMERHSRVLRRQKSSGRPVYKSRKKQTQTDVSILLNLAEAIQKNIHKFVEDLHFQETDLPDKLLENDCLTEDECSIISSKASRKDQVRHLIQLIRRRGPETMSAFLDLVAKNNPEIKFAVDKTLQEIQSRKKDKQSCIVCIMKTTVDLRDIADSLWGEQLIPDELYTSLTDHESHHDRDHLWKDVLRALCKHDDHEMVTEVFSKSLKPKYEHIVNIIQGMTMKKLICQCKRPSVKSRKMFCLSESQTDLSTTSEIQVPKFQELLTRSETSDTDSMSVTSSFGSSPRQNTFKLAIPDPQICTIRSLPETLEYPSNTKNEDTMALPANINLNGHISVDEKSSLQADTSAHRKRRETEHFEYSHSLNETYPNSASLSLNERPGPQLQRRNSSGTFIQLNSQSSQEKSSSTTDTSIGSPSDIKDITTDSGFMSTPASSDSATGPSDTSPITEIPETPITTAVQRPNVSTGNTAFQSHQRTKPQFRFSDELKHSSDDMDNTTEEFHIRRRRKRRKGLKIRRQMSEPVTELKTESRHVEPIAAKIGTRKEQQRVSKYTRKRTERRYRAEQNTGEYYTHAVGPYNPMRDKVLQPKQSRKWDYHEARRFWLLCHKNASSTPVSQKYESDPADLQEDSDVTLAYSEQTI